MMGSLLGPAWCGWGALESASLPGASLGQVAPVAPVGLAYQAGLSRMPLNKGPHRSASNRAPMGLALADNNWGPGQDGLSNCFKL